MSLKIKLNSRYTVIPKVIFDQMSHIKNDYIPSELDSWATGFFATLAIFEYLKTINVILTFHNQKYSI